jgi:hypothetical protein
MFRAELLSEFIKSGTRNGIEFRKPENLSLKRRGLDTAIADHLKKSNYIMTLSVFAADAKLKDTLSLPEKDVLKMLGISNQNLTTTAEGPLMSLVNYVDTLNNRSCSTIAVQTDKGSNSIDNELRKLDEDYLYQLEQYKRKTDLTLEEKFIQYQKNVDQRAAEEIASKIKIFEETTLNATRLEESAKYRERLAVIKDELDKEYMRKCARLNAREKQVLEKLEVRERELDKLQHEHRQQMYKETEKAQTTTLYLQNEKREIEKEKLHLEEKARRLDTLATQCSIDVRTEVAVLRAKLEKEYNDAMEKVNVQKHQLELDQAKLTAEKNAILEAQSIMNDTIFAKETLQETEESLKQVRLHLEETRKQNRQLTEECESLKEKLQRTLTEKASTSTIDPISLQYTGELRGKNIELEHRMKQASNYTIELEQSNRTLSEQVDKYEHQIKELKQKIEKTKHLTSIDQVASELREELQREKNNFRKLTYQFNFDYQQVQQRLENEMIKSEKLQRQVEDEYLKNRSLSHEVDILEQQLKQTQQALDAALSRDIPDDYESLRNTIPRRQLHTLDRFNGYNSDDMSRMDSFHQTKSRLYEFDLEERELQTRVVPKHKYDSKNLFEGLAKLQDTPLLDSSTILYDSSHEEPVARPLHKTSEPQLTTQTLVEEPIRVPTITPPVETKSNPILEHFMNRYHETVDSPKGTFFTSIDEYDTETEARPDSRQEHLVRIREEEDKRKHEEQKKKEEGIEELRRLEEEKRREEQVELENHRREEKRVEENRQREEKQRIEEERRREEERRLEQEQRDAERLQEEQRKREEEQRQQAEEQRRREEQRQREEEQRKREAEEQQRREEERIQEEQRKREAEEQREKERLKEAQKELSEIEKIKQELRLQKKIEESVYEGSDHEEFTEENDFGDDEGFFAQDDGFANEEDEYGGGDMFSDI